MHWFIYDCDIYQYSLSTESLCVERTTLRVYDGMLRGPQYGVAEVSD